jgi:hypothetical protein
MNSQIQGLSIHAEVHGTAEPALVFLVHEEKNVPLSKAENDELMQGLYMGGLQGVLEAFSVRRIPVASAAYKMWSCGPGFYLRVKLAYPARRQMSTRSRACSVCRPPPRLR